MYIFVNIQNMTLDVSKMSDMNSMKRRIAITKHYHTHRESRDKGMRYRLFVFYHFFRTWEKWLLFTGGGILWA